MATSNFDNRKWATELLWEGGSICVKYTSWRIRTNYAIAPMELLLELQIRDDMCLPCSKAYYAPKTNQSALATPTDFRPHQTILHNTERKTWNPQSTISGEIRWVLFLVCKVIHTGKKKFHRIECWTRKKCKFIKSNFYVNMYILWWEEGKTTHSVSQKLNRARGFFFVHVSRHRISITALDNV